MIRLQPVAMLAPNSALIYQPSRLSPVKEVGEAEFLQRYADHAQALRMSFDGNRTFKTMTAYGCGLCWYIVA